MEISIDIEGATATVASLRRLRGRIDDATRRAVERSMDVIEVNIKGQLRLKSHPRRTPTPSAPGEPPALITGALMRSVRGDPVVRVGDGWSGSVMPRTVYARIQELGGITGRGHHTVLPPRPYVTPAVVESVERIKEIFAEELGAAIGGAA